MYLSKIIEFTYTNRAHILLNNDFYPIWIKGCYPFGHPM